MTRGPIFVAACDTDVGKTIVSTILVNVFACDYWKPIQCGIEDGTDSQFVRDRIDLTQSTVHPEAHCLDLPKSPHLAAAKQGVSEAQYNLGTIYFDGLGVVQNFKKAFDNYLMSAENGFVMSQHKLSIMFLNGWGVEKDKIKAFMWVNIAASLNHEKSIEQRDEFLQFLSSKEIERGQDLSLICFEKMLKNC